MFATLSCKKACTLLAIGGLFNSTVFSQQSVQLQPENPIVLNNDAVTEVSIQVPEGHSVQWSNGSQHRTSLFPAGNHAVTVFDATNQPYHTRLFTVAKQMSPAAIFAFNIKIKPACNHASNASASVEMTNGKTADYTFYWSNGSKTATAQHLKTGTYTVTIAHPEGLDTTVVVDIPPADPIDIMVSGPVNAKEGELVQHHVTAFGGTNELHFVWSDGTIGPAHQHVASIEQPTLSVTVSDASGCQSITETMELNVRKAEAAPAKPFVNTLITPNGDGHQDFIAVSEYNGQQEGYLFTIVNMKGATVFNATNPASVWNGEAQNAPLPTGMYLYTLSYVDQAGLPQTQTGKIVLIR